MHFCGSSGRFALPATSEEHEYKQPLEACYQQAWGLEFAALWIQLDPFDILIYAHRSHICNILNFCIHVTQILIYVYICIYTQFIRTIWYTMYMYNIICEYGFIGSGFGLMKSFRCHTSYFPLPMLLRRWSVYATNICKQFIMAAVQTTPGVVWFPLRSTSQQSYSMVRTGGAVCTRFLWEAWLKLRLLTSLILWSSPCSVCCRGG